MSKITRALQKIFGSTAGGNQIGKFGSLAAGVPSYTLDPVVMQALTQFTDGWVSATLGNNSPAIEDMNGLFYLITYQLAYLLQQGIAEWDSTTTYFIGSQVNVAGVVYVSLTDNNLNNATTTTSWRLFTNKRKFESKTSNYTLKDTDEVIHANSSGGNVVITLPTAVGRQGTVFTVKSTAIGAFNVTLATTSAQTIDGETELTYTTAYESHDLISDNANWLILN